MVLSRNDKRKKREGDLVDLMEPLSESPKRTKVHAQRKFAQGASTVFTTSPIPVKDKEKVKPSMITELITHKRPNTEDFLTYLCFRGTSILPPSLNFFNFSNTKENLEPKPKPVADDTSANNTVSLPETSAETPKQETCQKNVTKVKPVVPEKKKMPSTIHKNISKLKTATSTVQALKKKYQEQRLAKQRIENKLKATCVRTRSSTERATLNTGVKLESEKFLPQMQTKRHGLRSGLLLNKANKSLSKAKIPPGKPKRKFNLRMTSTESSNTDESFEEEDDKEEADEDESQSEKTTSQIKRNVQKSIQKKVCTRSKSELRRVTRSSSGTISPKNISTRPTRKTKEAATVYMEILGRKLIQGSELETEDNVSIESYPELPNVRKLTQAENEVKAKAKQTAAKTVSKSKDCKVNSINDNKRLDKSKINNKLIQIKSKRLIRVQTYCEEDSDEEESASSVEVIEKNNTRPITRLSLGKLDKPINREQRSLRSSTKNTPPVQSEEPSNANNKPDTQAQNSVKPANEKLAVKRKRDQNPQKALSDISESKPKSLKNQNKDVESEEETLGMLLSKIKKKKENEEQERVSDDVSNTKDDATKHSEVVQSTKVDLSKVSDDEESFRGFTKKAISKVLDSCQTHANVNLLVDEKLDYAKMLNTPVDQKTSSPKQKEETSSVKGNSSVATSSNDDRIKTSLQQHKPLLDSSRKTQNSSLPSATQTSKKCSHEDEVSPNLMNMPLSALRSRKERVNMSTERIEKWLNESSLAKEESKLEMENVSTFRYDSTEKMKVDVSHLSIPTKIQHLVRPVNVTLSKLIDKTSLMDRLKMLNKNATPPKSNADTASDKSSTVSTSQNKIIIDAKEAVKIKSEKASKDTAESSDSASKSDQNTTDGSTEKKSSTDKKIFQPRKPFLPKVKERKTVTPNANAFSPENESSVYAFESDTEVPVSTPFRRKLKDNAKSTEKSTESLEPPVKPITKSTTKLVAKPTAKPIMKLILKPTAVVPAVTSSTSSIAASTKSTTLSMTSTVTTTVTSMTTSTITSTVASTTISTTTSTVVATVTSVATPILAVTSMAPSTTASTSKIQAAAEFNTPIVEESLAIPSVPNVSEKSTSSTNVVVMKDQEITAEAISMPNAALKLNNLVDLTNIKVLPLNKLVNNWSNENCSSSIAVQVNFDENTKEQQAQNDEQKTEKNINQQKSNEISTQTDANNDDDDDDDDEQLFYIPLQAITRSGPNLQKRQVIQGVAVKLDTDGRPGSNQRVLLRAKLVTKSPLAMELHPPPVGTVQPTTRGPPSPPGPLCPPGPLGSFDFTGQQQHLSTLTPSLKVVSSSVPIMTESIMTAPTMVVAKSPTTVVANTPTVVVANTPTAMVATMPITMIATTPTMVVATTPTKMIATTPTTPTTVVVTTSTTVVATTPTTIVATTPTTVVAIMTAATTLTTMTATTVTATTSNAEMQPASPAISDVQTTNTSSRQSSSASNNLERLGRSPMLSRERKASIDSAKSGKRTQMKCKQKPESSSTSNNNYGLTSYMNDEIFVVEAPTFHPTEKDFQDPLEYIDKIRPSVEKFGICKVVPPANFKPECKVSDDMRFTAYNQYVHRMLHRWGPNVKELMAIKKYLATQSITLSHPPWIGGMEVDLPHLYQTVQSLGGLKEVIEKKKWQKVADGMKIPKSAQDRVTKLDDIYCKYLLPYDTLSPDEREKLFDEVEQEWIKRESKNLERQETSSTDNDEEEEDDSSDEIEECIVKGRNMPLNAFYRIARNTQRMWFGENQRGSNETEGASASEVESAFWKHVAERKRHVCVHAASIDSSGRGFGFPVVKNSPFARHPWNLKVLTNNAGSVLRALGPLMGVTVPTLHVGMLFSACCWYRDPHGLPWIEYLHTGAKKIWYGIPDEHNNSFREALSKMVPQYCKNKTIWLPSDTAMVPPKLLIDNGVSLCQIVQEPGQFIIVFPKAFTSSICTGYVVSESVYFAQPSWLETAEQVFKDIQDSCEPSIFSFERLLFNIINDTRSQIDILKQILPSVIKIRKKELDYRKQLKNLGLTKRERVPLPGSKKGKKRKRVKEDDGDYECETCRANLFVSMVTNSQEDSFYCLPHALQLLSRKKQILKHCTLMYTYDEDELDELIQKLQHRIEAKSKKTNQIKQNR